MHTERMRKPIEDRSKDLSIYEQSGMYNIWIKQGNWKDACPREDSEQPDMVVESLSELREKVLWFQPSLYLELRSFKKDMEIRIAKQEEYEQLAEMKWLHCKEDEEDYNEKILDGVNKDDFVKEFVDFFINNKEYLIFIAQEDDMVVSGMFVYMIPKTPKPGRCPKFIAYLTNVYTRKEYRNKKIGTELLKYIKEYLKEKNCEMIFVWPSENSVPWYVRNDFTNENEIFQCDL